MDFRIAILSFLKMNLDVKCQENIATNCQVYSMNFPRVGKVTLSEVNDTLMIERENVTLDMVIVNENNLINKEEF